MVLQYIPPPPPFPRDFSTQAGFSCGSLGEKYVIYSNYRSTHHLKSNPKSAFSFGVNFLGFVWVGEGLNLEFIGRAFRNLSAVRDAVNFKSHLQSSWLSDSSAPCWSWAALPGLPELPAPGPGGGRRGPQSRGAASGLCALRESPEQCERGAERARPKGVTSLRCLIRRSACAARAAEAPVTARSAAAATAQQRYCAPAPPTLGPCERTVGPRFPAVGNGRRARDAGALLPG